MFEINSITNNRPAQGVVTTFGSYYTFPYAMLGGRLFRIGTQIDF